MAYDERTAYGNVAFRKHKRQVWRPDIGEKCMLAEFSIVPIGAGESLSGYVAECIRIVEASGLEYRLNPLGTVVEGEFDEVMGVVSACHKRIASMCPRVITSIKIDDRRGVTNALESKIESVRSKLEKG